MRVGQNAHMSMNALTLYTYTMRVSDLRTRIPESVVPLLIPMQIDRHDLELRIRES